MRVALLCVAVYLYCLLFTGDLFCDRMMFWPHLLPVPPDLAYQPVMIMCKMFWIPLLACSCKPGLLGTDFQCPSACMANSTRKEP